MRLLRRAIVLTAALAAGGAAHAADSVWDHNGSQMLWHAEGDVRVISYLVPRPGLSVATGTVLFEGRRVGPTMEGTARIFREGCPPAEYHVSGPVLSETEVVLYGAAPVRAGSGCAISGYSTESSNAALRFTYLRTATEADTMVNRVDAVPTEEPEGEVAGFEWRSVPLPGGSTIVVGIHYNIASHVMPDMVEAVLLCPPAPALGERPPLAAMLADGEGLAALTGRGDAHPLVGMGELNVCSLDEVSADLIERALLIDVSQYNHDTAACEPVQLEYGYDGYCGAPRGAQPQTRRGG